ncbi:restriction endonuclease subunit S [Polyangium fumosum]|uniref:Restriction endonuclease subunit S n=1 Tax=Polyangium fumosum TaxID=889272 RepID=A0A4V5PL50_9BACT|nr:restriction endonuclease subunit S [Polyangium fumosum]TKC97994.1 restriction endonuclease subunit S [Polyangium fumosum]
MSEISEGSGMTAEWRDVSIGELAAPDGIVGGPFGSDLVRADYVASGVPVIRGSNLGQGEKRFDANDLVFVSEDKANVLSRNLAVAGDIVVTQRGTLGQVGIVPPDSRYSRWLVSQSQMRLRCEPQVADPLYVYYWLLRPETVRSIRAQAIATGVPHINLGIFRSLRVALPPLKKQRAIAHILGAFDDKIDLLRGMNQTLEDTCRTLFQSWFVDFDAVHTRAARREPLGIDGETAKLFPRDFEESEIGPIPAGWRIAALGDFVSLQRGTTYQSALLEHDGPVLLGLASIQRDGGFRGDSLRTYGGESSEKILLRPGDLYVSLKDVTQSGDLLGAVARVPKWIASGRLTQDTVRLAPTATSIRTEYLYWLLRTPRYRQFCRSRAMGTTNLSLSRDDFLGYRFAVPPPSIQARLLPIIERMSERLEDASEIRTLTALRDTLLPKLLSGDLRIRDPESFLKEAGV